MNRFGMTRLRLWWERAFWVVPTSGVLTGVLLHAAVSGLDQFLATLPDLPPSEVASSSAAQLLSAIGGGMVTFVGFVFSFVVLILQFGSSQYSPRTVSYFLRAKSTRYILAIFLATISFTFLGLLTVSSGGRQDFTPETTVITAVGLLLVSLVAFIVLLHSVGGRVRVDAVLTAMGRWTRRELTRRLAAPSGTESAATTVMAEGRDSGIVVRSGRAGQTIAVDTGRLLRLGRRYGCRMTTLIQVGDSVSLGTPLLRIDSSVRPIPARVLAALGRGVVVDQERSLRHDPFYSLRLIVDVAVKALSPGINDPTTAVRALDEIEGVLRVASTRALGPRRLTFGKAELVLRIPTWGDVVVLALLETALLSGDQPQVSRRLVALINELAEDLPDERRAPLVAILDKVRTVTTRAQGSGALAAFALGADRQGLGGGALLPGRR